MTWETKWFMAVIVIAIFNVLYHIFDWGRIFNRKEVVPDPAKYLPRSIVTNLERQVTDLQAKLHQAEAQVDKLWEQYQDLIQDKEALEAKYLALLRHDINKKTYVTSQFTTDEIKQLIRLCHPDKHNNSAVATSITQRLLELRK